MIFKIQTRKNLASRGITMKKAEDFHPKAAPLLPSSWDQWLFETSVHRMELATKPWWPGYISVLLAYGSSWQYPRASILDLDRYFRGWLATCGWLFSKQADVAGFIFLGCKKSWSTVCQNFCFPDPWSPWTFIYKGLQWIFVDRWC